jgi:putative ABC transport system permease protein
MAMRTAITRTKSPGVLAPCGCVLDRLILTATESVWQVHEKALAVDAEDSKALEAEREVTLALITYRSPLGGGELPAIRQHQHRPCRRPRRRWRSPGCCACWAWARDVLRGFGAVLLLVAGLSVFIALWSAVRERRADLALLRMLGAPPGRLATMLICEALWLAVLASVLGLLGGHLLTGLIGWMLQADRSLPITGWLWLAEEAWVPVSAAAVAVLAALIPAVNAYRADVAQMLSSR